MAEMSRPASPTSAVVDLEVENVMLAKSDHSLMANSSAARQRKINSAIATSSSSKTTTTTTTTLPLAASAKPSRYGKTSGDSTPHLTFDNKCVVGSGNGRHRRHSAAAASSSSVRRSKSASSSSFGHCSGSHSTSVSPSKQNGGRKSEDACSVRRSLASSVTFGDTGARKSAFSPYKPTTVLTNLQRGNIETQTPCFFPDPSMHQLAAQGELELDQDNGGRSLDEPDQDGLTPLMWASAYGQTPTVHLLLSRGANPHATNGRLENALLLASSRGHVDIARKLLKEGVDVDHMDEHGNTALMYAAFNNHACCAQELLVHKADITKENHYGDTAFCISIARSSKQVQIVLERHILRLLKNSINALQWQA